MWCFGIAFMAAMYQFSTFGATGSTALSASAHRRSSNEVRGFATGLCLSRIPSKHGLFKRHQLLVFQPPYLRTTARLTARYGPCHGLLGCIRHRINGLDNPEFHHPAAEVGLIERSA